MSLPYEDSKNINFVCILLFLSKLHFLKIVPQAGNRIFKVWVYGGHFRLKPQGHRQSLQKVTKPSETPLHP